VKESYLDAYVSAGFQSVRVPCRWDKHVGTSPPYISRDNAFLARVHEVVRWSTERGLPTVINTHHDDWLDGSANDTAFAHNLERLVAIWEAISARFKHVPDKLLAFEVYNEPHYNMTTDCARARREA
jgi:endoglucanase